MKRILFLLPAFALLGGCAAVLPIIETAIGVISSPAGQMVIRSLGSAAQVVECDLAGTSSAGTFRHTSSAAVCSALGGVPMRTVVAPAGTPVAVPAQ